MIIFDPADNAAAAQDVLKPPASHGPELISSDLYEVGAQAYLSLATGARRQHPKTGTPIRRSFTATSTLECPGDYYSIALPATG